MVAASLAGVASDLSADSAEPWSVASPDGRNVLTIRDDADGSLTYTVKRDGNTVLLPSPLGLTCDDADFSSGLRLVGASQLNHRREQYELNAGANSRVDKLLSSRLFTFANAQGAEVSIEVVASDDGVAFRYRFDEPREHPRVVEREATGFALPADSRGWLTPYHVATKDGPAYEDYYFNVAMGEKAPKSKFEACGWATPALFEVAGADTWALVLESGLDGRYCGSHLVTTDTPGLYRIEFAHADEVHQGVPLDSPVLPTSTLPWATPWRVIVLGEPEAIYESTLVTDLALPTPLKDTSWIKPGRASWGWVAQSDGPYTAAFFNHYTDLAAEFDWEYTTFDAGWWDTDLEAIASYAGSKGVQPLIWWNAGEVYDAAFRRRKMDSLVRSGVKGVKIDFWCSDRQAAMQAINDVLADAADRRLVVVLHGCTAPRGWERTWPNLLSLEGVMGLEQYKFDSRYPEKVAEYNTVVPFSRNVAGSMDYTPVVISDVNRNRKTTAAHELATSIVFSSGIIHFADRPESYASLPEDARGVLRDAPARWDESRCLLGRPGETIVVARRSGDEWFIAGLNGLDQPVDIELDLATLGPLDLQTAKLVSEGHDAHAEFATSAVNATGPWRRQMPPRGGFVLRVRRP